MAGTKDKFGQAGRRACRAGHHMWNHTDVMKPPRMSLIREVVSFAFVGFTIDLSILPLLLVLDRHHHTHPAGPKQHT